MTLCNQHRREQGKDYLKHYDDCYFCGVEDGRERLLADVRREINDRWGAASFSSYRARVLEVLDQLEQRGTTTTEDSHGPQGR